MKFPLFWLTIVVFADFCRAVPVAGINYIQLSFLAELYHDMLKQQVMFYIKTINSYDVCISLKKVIHLSTASEVYIIHQL